MDKVSCSRKQHLLLVGIEPGTSRSRVRCFTTAPQRSTVSTALLSCLIVIGGSCLALVTLLRKRTAFFLLSYVHAVNCNSLSKWIISYITWYNLGYIYQILEVTSSFLRVNGKKIYDILYYEMHGFQCLPPATLMS